MVTSNDALYSNCHEGLGSGRYGRNAYTDAQPRFPYDSRFVQHELGLPPLPVLHLAATDLADRLRALDVGAARGAEECFLEALKVAWRTVLSRQPFEYAAIMYCSYVDASEEAMAWWQAQPYGPRTDWMRLTLERLRREGWTGDPRVRGLS